MEAQARQGFDGRGAVSEDVEVSSEDAVPLWSAHTHEGLQLEMRSVATWVAALLLVVPTEYLPNTFASSPVTGVGHHRAIGRAARAALVQLADSGRRNGPRGGMRLGASGKLSFSSQ